MLVAARVGVIDLTRGTMNYEHAGHAVPLIAPDRRMREVCGRVVLMIDNIPEATYAGRTPTLSLQAMRFSFVLTA